METTREARLQGNDTTSAATAQAARLARRGGARPRAARRVGFAAGLATVLGLALGLGGAAIAQEPGHVQVKLRDGRVVEGHLVDFGARTYRVRLADGRTASISEREVAEIIFRHAAGAEAEATEPARSPGAVETAGSSYGVPWTQARSLETEHYAIRHNLSLDDARAIASFLEALHDARVRTAGLAFAPLQQKVPVWVFRDAEDFQRHGGGFPGVESYYAPSGGPRGTIPARAVVTFFSTFAEMDVHVGLAKESTFQHLHALLRGGADQLLARPAWWLDGLATYVGEGHASLPGGEATVHGRAREQLRRLQRELAEGEPVHLADLIRMPYGGAYMAHAARHRAYAWGLYYYLSHRGGVSLDGRVIDLQGALRTFHDHCLAAAPGPEAPPAAAVEAYAQRLEALLGGDLEPIQADFIDFMRGLEFPQTGHADLSARTFKTAELDLSLAWTEGWRCELDEVRGRELLRLVHDATGGLARLIRRPAEAETVEQLAERAERGAHYRFDDLVLEPPAVVRMAGHRAYELGYEGRDARHPARAGDTSAPRVRVRHQVARTQRFAYELILQGEPARFSELTSAFADVSESLHLRDSRYFAPWDLAAELQEARMGANESGAIASLRTIVTAQSIFRDTDRDGDGLANFATSLAELSAHGRLIDDALASGVKQGYRYRLEGGAASWWAIAEPVERGHTGRRSFFVDDSAVIRSEPDHRPTASAKSPPLGG